MVTTWTFSTIFISKMKPSSTEQNGKQAEAVLKKEKKKKKTIEVLQATMFKKRFELNLHRIIKVQVNEKVMQMGSRFWRAEVKGYASLSERTLLLVFYISAVSAVITSNSNT